MHVDGGDLFTRLHICLLYRLNSRLPAYPQSITLSLAPLLPQDPSLLWYKFTSLRSLSHDLNPLTFPNRLDFSGPLPFPHPHSLFRSLLPPQTVSPGTFGRKSQTLNRISVYYFLLLLFKIYRFPT